MLPWGWFLPVQRFGIARLLHFVSFNFYLGFWLPFLDTYRTMCHAPEPAYRRILEENSGFEFRRLSGSKSGWASRRILSSRTGFHLVQGRCPCMASAALPGQRGGGGSSS